MQPPIKPKPPQKSTTLYCFSPPVMLATFLIEIIGALYAFIRYKLTQPTRLIIALLVCLSIFQLAEFFICETPALPGLTWARIGHVAITLLPPLGISLAMSIAGKKSKLAQAALYSAATAFVIYFLFISSSLTAETCAGNYIIFQSGYSLAPYAIYYYGFLALGTFLPLYWSHQSKKPKTKRALNWLAIGYLTFLLPTTTVNLLDPSTTAAIPSIMCGFAVFLALILIFVVLPSISTKKKRT